MSKCKLCAGVMGLRNGRQLLVLRREISIFIARSACASNTAAIISIPLPCVWLWMSVWRCHNNECLFNRWKKVIATRNIWTKMKFRVFSITIVTISVSRSRFASELYRETVRYRNTLSLDSCTLATCDVYRIWLPRISESFQVKVFYFRLD